ICRLSRRYSHRGDGRDDAAHRRRPVAARRGDRGEHRHRPGRQDARSGLGRGGAPLASGARGGTVSLGGAGNRPVTLHPFTPFVLVGGVAALAFLLPPPVGPVALYGSVLIAALAAGMGGAAVAAGLVLL